jgi:hypothetical protein
MEYIIYYLNNDKIFMGCSMMLMNIGGKYMHQELPKSLDKIFENKWLRRLVIFCVAFVSTRDIKISLFITLIFILLFSILLNENSKGCILPKKYLDFNDDGIISPEEIKKAKEILKKYYIKNKKIDPVKISLNEIL